MTITNYSNAILSAMLSWLKGLANWVLRLFNLAGGASPLFWLANNWLKLLIFFMVLGVGMDLLVWLIRWRPYWVWFRKERVIVNDDRFFAGENMEPEDEWVDDALDENWQERDYVVATPSSRPARQPSNLIPARRHRAQGNGSAHSRQTAQRQRAGSPRQAPAKRDSLFDVDMNRPESTDFYEDAVFNVSNLPSSDEQREKHDE